VQPAGVFHLAQRRKDRGEIDVAFTEHMAGLFIGTCRERFHNLTQCLDEHLDVSFL
jgi:hypothetical protein